MISRIQFAALKPSAASPNRFGAKKRSGLVASTLIAGSLLTGLAPKALSEEPKPTTTGQKAASTEKPHEKPQVPGDNHKQPAEIEFFRHLETAYSNVEYPYDHIPFLILTLEKYKDHKHYDVPRWTLNKMKELPLDRYKLQFLLAAVDIDIETLHAEKAEILKSLEDTKLKHHVGLLITLKHETTTLQTRFEGDLWVLGDKLMVYDRLAKSREAYEKQWQFLDKMLEKMTDDKK